MPCRRQTGTTAPCSPGASHTHHHTHSETPANSAAQSPCIPTEIRRAGRKAAVRCAELTAKEPPHPHCLKVHTEKKRGKATTTTDCRIRKSEHSRLFARKKNIERKKWRIEANCLVFWRWVARASLLIFLGVFSGSLGLHCSTSCQIRILLRQRKRKCQC
jgi:hypothetical protein